MTAGAEGSPVFDFTSLDFTSVETDLLRYVLSRYPDELWTDLNESNPGRRLIELMSYATDLVSYNENAQVRETVVSSLIRRQNFIRIARMYDYRLNAASPSRTTLLFTVTGAGVTIPTNFQVADSSGEVIFEPNVTGTSVGATYSVEATQGETVGSEALGVSDGGSGQAYTLARSPLLDNTLIISVGGAVATEVHNFIEATATDLVYLLETDENDVSRVTFGDGSNGRIPPLGASITATYRVGGGSQGNLPINAIQRLVSSLPGVVSVTNTAAATGGGPKQSLLSGKRQLPLHIKSNYRAVTVEDYATLAVNLVPEVYRARGISGRYEAGGNPVLLFIVPQGGGVLTPTVANKIVTTMRFGTSTTDPGRAMAGKRVVPTTAVYVYILIDVDAYVQQGSRAVDVAARVRSVYETQYALDRVDFADALDLQDAYEAASPTQRNIDGLQRVFLRTFTILPATARYVTRPTTGNGTVERITTLMDTVQRREWNIEVVTPTPGYPGPEFLVRQRRLGTITAIGSNSLEDDKAFYAVNELAGMRVRPREQEQDEHWLVAANSEKSITVTGVSAPTGLNSLLLAAVVGDTYAVEADEGNRGKIVRTTPSASHLAGVLTVAVASTLGFRAGDFVLIREGANEQIVELQSVGVGDLVLVDVLAFAVTVATTIDWYWYSDDGTVGFALINGTNNFTIGDQLYVDTYNKAGDIRLRPENFPRLLGGNLTVNPIGGVK